MDWKDVVNYGLPMLILACVTYGLVKFAAWMRSNVVEPIVKAHVELIEVLKKEIPDQGRKLNAVTEGMKEVAKIEENMLRGQVDKVEEIKVMIHEQTETITLAIEHQTDMLKNDGKRGRPPEAGGPT